ncbi:MAG: hypothetical protein B7Y45_13345 [Sphingomonas sp. 28-66-16]|nr:MAG: hypothetical protein B7Y45_13345 [Sphingomonas sp. 28-66-16]
MTCGIDLMTLEVFLQRILCLFGQHRRNRRKARLRSIGDYDAYQAPCLGCGAPMIKIGTHWRLHTADEQAHPES